MLYRIAIVVYRVYFHPLAKIPGPKFYAASRLPILYLHNIQGTWIREAISFHAKYGPIVRIGPDLLSVDGSIGYPEIYSQRLHGKSEHTKHPKQFDEYYNGSLLTAGTAEHRRLRRIFAPAFTEKAIRAQEPILQRATTFLTQQVAKRQSQTIDINKWINYTMFDINGELSLGESFHSVERDELHFWIKFTFESLRATSMVRFLREYRWLRIFKSLLLTQEMINKIETHENTVRERIAKRIEAGAETKEDFMTYFMGHMEKGALTKEQILINAGIFIVAGGETSSVASSTLLYYLCKESEVYKELTSEIRNAFASEDEITIAATMKLAHLNLCLNEAMRIHAPAPELNPRRSPGDYVGGYWVPEGVCSLSSILNFEIILLPPLNCYHQTYLPDPARPSSPSLSMQLGQVRRTSMFPTLSALNAMPPKNPRTMTLHSHRITSPLSNPLVWGQETASAAT